MNDCGREAFEKLGSSFNGSDCGSGGVHRALIGEQVCADEQVFPLPPSDGNWKRSACLNRLQKIH